MADDLKDVVMRLDRIEKSIGGRGLKAAALSAADISAYHKVQNAFWEDGTCGINETSPCIFKCNIITGDKVVPIPFPRQCDVECTCGPCNIFGGGFGGGGRFRGMGG